MNAAAQAAITGRLSWPRRLGFCSGGFAFNILFQTAALLLMFYYTDVLGLSPAVAGYVFAGALIWDAVFDPFMGYMANRTRTRWGRYRPYLLLGAIPLAISWALVFLPTGFQGAALIIYALIAHILFRTIYAVVNMPYLAMNATVTSDSQERGVLTGIGLVLAALSSVFSSFATLKLVGVFGGGQIGFFWTAVLYGALSVITLLIVFASTTPEAVTEQEDEKPTAREMIKMLSVNRAFWIVAVGSLLGQVGGTFFSKTLPYYLKYSLGREDLIPACLGVMALMVMFSVPLWLWVMRRWSKRTMWLTGGCVDLTGSLLLWLLPQQPNLIIMALALRGVGICAGFIGFWAMMADTVEYGEWRSGVRAEGAIYGLVSLISKAGLGVAAAILGELLSLIGYRPNTAQSAATLEQMRFIMIALPAMLSVAALSAIAFYPIDQKLHGRLLRAISWRRARRATLPALNIG